MAITPSAYTRMIDMMRIMSYGLTTPIRGSVAKPLTLLDPDQRNASSILGLVGSPHPEPLSAEPARTDYYAAVLPSTPQAIMEPLLAVAGHPRVWAAEFMAAAARYDAVKLRDELLVPYLVPQNADLTKFRFLTLGMAEFVCIWSALWLAKKTATPDALAGILVGLDPLCPAYHKRLFHEDIPVVTGSSR
jgi:hypothetical protein